MLFHFKVFFKGLQILVFTFICINGFAQKEATYWYFGEGAGIDFSSGSPVAVNDSEMFASEGCATISDCNGDLLFYSNGVEVWDRNHDVMYRGSGLLGDLSSAQGVIIVPKPGDVNIYYIFTLDDKAGDNGLRYSKVDMALNNGNGGIVISEKNILIDDHTTERLTVAGHANGEDFWVVTHDWNSSHFQSYLVDGSGVNAVPVVSAIGATYSGDPDNAIGCIKVSPDGKRLAITKMSPDEERFVQVFDFDNATGTLSNLVFISGLFYDEGLSGTYGLEFSPDSNLLYVADIKSEAGLSKVHQFNIGLDTPSDVINSDHILYEGSRTLGSLQLGIDQKIYVSGLNDAFLDSIENPNIAGEGANYVNESVLLNGRNSYYGLPQFVYNDFSFQIDEVVENCLGESTIFSITVNFAVDSILWEFGDGNISNLENPTHTYTDAGTYNVSVTINYGAYCKSKNINVTIPGIPDLNILPDYEVCDDESNDGYELFDLEAYHYQNIGDQYDQYTVTYHNSFNDADLGINALDGFYRNSIPNEETIYIRVESVENENCYQVASFRLIVNPLVTIGSGNQLIIDVEVNDLNSGNNSITVMTNGNSEYEYSIDGINYQESNFFDNLQGDSYTVYVKDIKNCEISKKLIFLLNYPKYFTPNNDGVNDVWKVTSSNLSNNIIINIFDRYGKLIKHLPSSSNSWDGTFNGNPLPTSDYWFILKKTNSQEEFVGHFTLKR